MDPFRSLPVTLTANFIMLTQENSIEAPYAKDMHDKWFLSREECLSHSNKSKLLVVIVIKKQQQPIHRSFNLDLTRMGA